MIAHSILNADDSYVVLPVAWCGDCEAHRPAAGAVRQGWRCLVCRTLRDELGCAVADVHPAPALELIKTAAEVDVPPCTCITTNPHAVNCRYRFWKLTHGEQL
jgi:hypothetical protein